MVYTTAVLSYYPLCFSTTGTQIQRHSVWLSALPPFFFCVTTNTHTVLPVNKYSLSSQIINTVLVKSSLKDETVCVQAYMNTKHTELHCWKILLLCFFFCFFFFFLALALRPKNLKWIESKRHPGGDLPAPKGPNVLQVWRKHTYRHTNRHTNSIAGQYKKRH